MVQSHGKSAGQKVTSRNQSVPRFRWRKILKLESNYMESVVKVSLCDL